MTSRIAITILLALGIMMSGAGATLAVSGLADEGGSAAQVQYPEEEEPREQEDEGGDDQAVLGEQASGGEAQADEQAAADNLAFTGFAAIPLLLLGVGLFSAGVVMRRRARPDDSA